MAFQRLTRVLDANHWVRSESSNELLTGVNLQVEKRHRGDPSKRKFHTGVLEVLEAKF
jgi:hypothetical protein